MCQGQRSIQPGGFRSKVNPAGGGGGVGQVKGQSSWGGGQVNPAGGVQVKGQSSQGGSGQRSIQPGGVTSSRGGVSILRPLAGGMPLAFTQEDFLVAIKINAIYATNPVSDNGFYNYRFLIPKPKRK